MAKEKSFKSQYYKDYLGLNKILDSQNLISDEFDQHAHDEMLFIITHQVYELWFKPVSYTHLTLPTICSVEI